MVSGTTELTVNDGLQLLEESGAEFAFPSTKKVGERPRRSRSSEESSGTPCTSFLSWNEWRNLSRTRPSSRAHRSWDCVRMCDLVGENSVVHFPELSLLPRRFQDGGWKGIGTQYGPFPRTPSGHAPTKEGVGLAAAPKTNVQDLPSIVTVEIVGYERTDKTPGAPEDRKKERKGSSPTGWGCTS